ncbi:MAG: hypothetical protein ACYC3H_11715 [Bellilinea sp.]
MFLYLLDDSLSVNVYYESSDNQFSDNICIHFWESCPEEEKVFLGDETHLYLTPHQARQLAGLLLAAADASDKNHQAPLEN